MNPHHSFGAAVCKTRNDLPRRKDPCVGAIPSSQAYFVSIFVAFAGEVLLNGGPCLKVRFRINDSFPRADVRLDLIRFVTEHFRPLFAKCSFSGWYVPIPSAYLGCIDDQLQLLRLLSRFRNVGKA